MKTTDKKSTYEETKKTYTQVLEKSCNRDKKRLIRYFDNLFPTIERSLENKKDVRILDAGCGTGLTLAFFAKKGYKNLEGIDVNGHSLSLVKKNCPLAKTKIGDVYKLPFNKDSFDLVIMTEVIEHLDHPRKALSEIKRVLKTGGVLFLTTPNRMGLMGLSNGPVKFFTEGFYYKSFLRIMGKTTCGPEHPKEYFSFELSKILESEGFKTIAFPIVSLVPLFPSGKFYVIARKER